LWQHLAQRRDGESVMYASMPQPGDFNENILALMETTKEVITGVRGVRAAKNIPMKDMLTLNVIAANAGMSDSLVRKLANVEAVNYNATKDAAAVSFMVGTTEFNIPLSGKIDTTAEIERLRKEEAYLEGFLASVMKKLSNERFVSNAPAAVVESEKKKQADAESKLANIRASIAALS
ncbi:MAG: valine--tRNA ligase, partial [Muribaculaceae bacterium]|nr:valine--tRNA ligase [Muribaculaceae bacterium]